MKFWRRLSIVIIGFVESLLFSGCLFGWPSLMYVLQQEGVYSHLCIDVNDSSSSAARSIDLSSPPDLITSWILPTTSLPENLFQSAYDDDDQNINDTNGSGSSITFDPDTFQQNENQIIFEQKQQHEEIQSKDERTNCKEQDVQMTFIYTVAAVSYGLTSILIGFSLDILGLWFTRIGGCIMTSGGFFLLAFTSQASSWLLWPALILLALGTSQLRLSSFQFANLWPEYRTTILILYSSAYSVSTTLFLIIQISYVGSIPYKTIGLALAIISLLTFPPTLIMPRMKIEPQLQEKVAKGKVSNENDNDEIKLNRANTDDNVPRILRNKDDDSKLMNPFDEPDSGGEKMRNKKKPISEDVPLSTSIFTLSAGLHIFWQWITFFLVLFYSSTFMLWIQMTTKNAKMIEHYNKMSGVCALIAPIFIPLAGLVTDWQIRRAAKNEDREERLALTMQAPALTKGIASLFVMATMICKVYFSPAAIYTSMILIAVSRPFIVGSCTSYLQIRFHPSHFNRLNGIFTTIVSIMSLVQFPIILWMKQSSNSFVQAQLFLIALLILAFSSPGHMMIKSVARRYARAQLKFRTDV